MPDRDAATDEVLRRLRDHPDPRVRAVADAAQETRTPPTGVHRVTPGERAEARGVAAFVLASGTVESHDLSAVGQPAALVTALLTAAAERPDADRWITAVADGVAALPGAFRPDVPGLLRVYAGLLALSDDRYIAMWDEEDLPRLPRLHRPPPLDTTIVVALRRVVAWIVSRAGLVPLLVELDRHLGSTATSDGYAIVTLMTEAAEVVDDPGTTGVEPAGPAEPPAIPDDDVQFTVYRPQTVPPERWHPLLAFAHRSTPFVDRDGRAIDPATEMDEQATRVLGPRVREYRTVAADSAASLPRGSMIVFEPWINGGEVNPPRAAFRWEEPVHRVEFRFRVPATAEAQRVHGGLRVYFDVIRLADLTFTVRVDDAASHAPVVPTEPVRGRPYQRIFPAYSHRDREIVARLREAAAALGARYVGDHELQAGEEWEPRLAEMIDHADAFQLFWSRNSMQSPFVRREWEHALSLNREHFILPVYWEDPRPEDRAGGLPPADLDRLHFCLLTSAAPVSAPSVRSGRTAVVATARPPDTTVELPRGVVARPATAAPRSQGLAPPPPRARAPQSTGSRPGPVPAAPAARAEPPPAAAPWAGPVPYPPGGYAPGGYQPPPYGRPAVSYGGTPPSAPAARPRRRAAIAVAVAVALIVLALVGFLLLR